MVEPSQSGAPETKKHLLLVDDETALCEVLKARLEMFGYSVATANDGKQAWEALVSKLPDLVLLDIRMPNEDGFTLLRKFRSYRDDKDPGREERIRNLPVIVITGTGEGMKSLFEQERISGYVKKPIDSAVLKKLIEENLNP